MAKIVDDAIGRLPENIQREMNDAWASGKSSPYTRVVDPLNATLLHRAQTIRGMQMEVAALKAQRDELLAGLNCALQALTFVRYVVGKPQIYTGSEVMTQRHESAITEISALIAKHKGSSHG